MKLTKNQSGISHIILVLLLLVAVGVVGYVGYKVGTSKKAPANNTDSTDTIKKEESKVPEGFVEYDNKELGFKFAYPKEWKLKVTKQPADYPPNSRDLPIIELTSDDFQEDEEAFAYGGTKTGAIYYFYALRTDKKSIEEVEAVGVSQFRKDVKSVTVSNTKAIDFFVGYEGPPHQFLEFVHNGFELSFSYRYKEDQNSAFDKKYLTIRQQIIDTIEFL